MTKRMKELAKILNEACQAYYNGTEIMSDKEYDELYDEMRALEKEYGPVPGSPTNFVGAAPKSALKKVRHEKPALSLDKTKDITELEEWLGNRGGVLSWKMDGLTIVATYENGSLLRAVTRGDGYIGEDVTENAKSFLGLPTTIPFKGKLVLRAEAVITYEEFRRINASLPEGEEPYKNPRNLVSGTVRLLDGIGDRIVNVYAFELVEAASAPGDVMSRFKFLEKQGIQVVPHSFVTRETLADEVSLYETFIYLMSFPSDGLVLALDDYEYGISLGVTGKYPRHSIAFKWKDETYETVLRGIEWSSSPTGLLNPVAVYDPVEVEGTTITRASLHNVSYMKNLRLGIGDRVTVYKANKIIPQIAENLTKSGTAVIPDTCPICGGRTEVVTRVSDGREVSTLYCANPECPAKHLGKFQRFVGREAMNIVGLSDETLKKFIDKGFLKNLPDIYRLEEHYDSITEMEGFGKKSADKLLEAIYATRDAEPSRFLFALGIPNVGRDTAKKIIRYCGGTIEGFLDKLRFGESFTGADDVGGVINRSIYEWKATDVCEKELPELMEILSFRKEETASGVLAGKTVVITGSLETFRNRDEFIAFVEENGG